MRSCLVVGASGAIGRAVAERLTASGWRCLRSSSRAAQRDVEAHIDLSCPDRFASALASLPPLDGTVICAGLEPQQSLREMQPAHLHHMMGIHVMGPILLLQALRDKLQDGAAVVLLSSIAAFRGSYDPAYAAAKGAVVSLTKSLAREWSPGLRVNALAPGLVADTPVYERMTPDFRQRHLDATPLGRLAEPTDCARAVEFLLTQPHLSGVVLHLNGGQYNG